MRASVESSPLRSHHVKERHDEEDFDDTSTGPSFSSPGTQPLETKPWNVSFGPFSLQTSPNRLAHPKRQRPEKSALHALRHELEKRHPGVLKRIASTGESPDDVFLARWLQARGENTIDSLAAHAEWRLSFVGPNPRGITEESLASELAYEKIFLQGIDKQGFPVLIFFAARHTASAHSADMATRLMAYSVDNAVLQAHSSPAAKGRIVCIFNMKGVGARNIDSSFLREIFAMFASEYPNCIKSLYFVNAPLLFRGVWKCVTPFVAQETRGKISFLSGSGGQKQLLDTLGAACLPLDLGGSAELVPVDVAVATARGEAGSRHHPRAIARNNNTNGLTIRALGFVFESMLSMGRAVGRGGRAAQSMTRRMTPDVGLLSPGMLARVLLLSLLVTVVQVVLSHTHYGDLLGDMVPRIRNNSSYFYRAS